MKENYKTQEKIYDAEVLESSTIDENIIIKILIKAGRTIAKPALEVLEMALDPYTPAQVRVSLMAALAYLIMPFDLFSFGLLSFFLYQLNSLYLITSKPRLSFRLIPLTPLGQPVH